MFIFVYICSYLKEHPNITSLNVSWNKISLSGTKELAGIKSLKTIDLSWNDIVNLLDTDSDGDIENNSVNAVIIRMR